MGISFTPAPVVAPTLPTGEPGQILMADDTGTFVPAVPPEPPALPTGEPGQTLMADDTGTFVPAAPPATELPEGESGQALVADDTGTFVPTEAGWGGGNFYRSGKYYFGAPHTSTSTTNASANTCYVVGYMVHARRRFDRIGAVIVTTPGAAGMVLRMAIYRAAGSFPGTLMTEGSAPATATGSVQVPIDITLEAGLHWIGILPQGAEGTVTLRTQSGISPPWAEATSPSTSALFTFAQVNVTGAFPSPFVGGQAGGGLIQVMLRAA